ncbi:DUF7322 domain-containing protein [Halobacterium zhouii]|uniref:DUF7322 domain-containing protein n=1 Tax=Halobacterium zhouii TaxID=2902624 RepID=UPI001E5E2C8B|nr:hypothetical protein [Halobacterium zhouii]
MDDDPLEETLFEDEQTDAEQALAPSVDVPDGSNADPQLRRQFWFLVVVFNVALLALSVGLMLAAFRGRWNDGLTGVAAGVILFGYGYYRYRTITRD